MGAALLTGRPPGLLVRAAIRFYQAYLTRWTPKCAQHPCCSDFAYEHGLRMAWMRMRDPVRSQAQASVSSMNECCSDLMSPGASVGDYGPNSCCYGLDPRSMSVNHTCCFAGNSLGMFLASLVFDGSPWRGPSGPAGCECT